MCKQVRHGHRKCSSKGTRLLEMLHSSVENAPVRKKKPFQGADFCRAIAAVVQGCPWKPSFVCSCCYWNKKKVTFWGNNSLSLYGQLLLYGSFCGLTNKLFYSFFQRKAALQLEKSPLGSVPQLHYPSLLQWTQRSLTYFYVIMRLRACAAPFEDNWKAATDFKKNMGRLLVS